MPRLPTPGGDSGNWGEILNEYLGVSLSANGELKPDSITQDHLQTDSVGRDQLAADSVTTYNLADASVTDDKLADQSVNAAKLAPGTLTKSAVGLGSADNTSDADKPVSTATQTALDTKVAGPTSGVSDNALVRFDGATGKLVQGSGVTVDDSGRLGIGTNTPSSSLDIVSHADMTASTTSGSGTQLYINANLGNNTRYATSVSSRLRLITNASSALTENDYGYNAVSASPHVTGDGTVNSFAGYLSRGIYYGGAVSKHYLYRAIMPQDQSSGSASIGTLYGFYASGLTNSLSARGFSFYQAGVDDFNYFAGKTGINTESPTHSLTLSAASTGIVLYNTADQTGNYERVRQQWGSNTFSIVSESGSGTPRTLRLSSSISILEIGTGVGTQSNAAFVMKRDSTSAAVITEITSASLTSTNSIQSMLAINPTLNQSGTAGYTILKINPTETSTGSGAKILADFQLGGVSKFKIANTGQLSIVDGTQATGRVLTSDANGNASWQVNTAGPAGPAEAVANPGTTFDITSAMFPSLRTITLSANLTLTLSASPASNLGGTITLVLKQSANEGPYTVTWPASIEWAGDAPGPSMPTPANSELIIHLLWTGSVWRGTNAGSFFP